MNGKRNHVPSADNSDGQDESIDHELQIDGGVSRRVFLGAAAALSALPAVGDMVISDDETGISEGRPIDKAGVALDQALREVNPDPEGENPMTALMHVHEAVEHLRRAMGAATETELPALREWDALISLNGRLTQRGTLRVREKGEGLLMLEASGDEGPGHDVILPLDDRAQDALAALVENNEVDDADR